MINSASSTHDESHKNYLGNKLKSTEGINDEIIEQFLEEITIGEDGKVVITLNSGFSFTFL